MLALYLITLGLSSGIVGVFVRQTLGESGYLHGFRTEVFLAAGVACAYAGVQLAFVGLLRVVKPAKPTGPLIAECCSHAAALLLVPYLMRIPIPWPEPLLEKLAPLVFFAAFGLLHLFMKLAAFYAALRAEPAGRLAGFAWLIAATAVFAGAAFFLQGWAKELALARPQQPSAPQPFPASGQYAFAREFAEGVIFRFDLQPQGDSALTFRVADVPPDPSSPLSKLYLSITLEGETSAKDTYPVSLNKDGWTDLVIAPGDLPPGMRSCTVVWDVAKPPKWQRLLGIRPLASSSRKIMLAGPLFHTFRDPAPAAKPAAAPATSSEAARPRKPSIVLIAIEGLAADHVGYLGYKRPTTAGLDRMAQSAVIYPNAYTPAPEAFAACMSMLTGLSPLRHGCLEKHRVAAASNRSPIAETLAGVGFTTAAFTQGEAPDGPDLTFGSGAEQGFEIFDPAYTEAAANADVAAAATCGSAATLAKARAWLDEHADRASFVFIRLRELRDPKWCARYAPGFVDKPETAAAADIYDSAIAYTDRLLADFVKHIRGSAAGKSTCILITSAYGLDFSPQRPLPIVGLTEKTLHVPLMLLIPDAPKEQRAGSVSLEDIAATVASLARLPKDFSLDGRDLLDDLSERHPIAFAGSPLALTLRIDRWRFSWQSGMKPFTWEPEAPPAALELYDVFQAKRAGIAKNELAKYPDLAIKYTKIVEDYLRKAMAAQ